MFYQNKLKTKTINKNLESIPFEDAAEIWDIASSQAVERAELDLTLAYDAEYNHRKKTALARLGSAEASFEGDIDIPYEPPTLSDEDREKISSRAASEALKTQFIKVNHFSSFGVPVLEQLITRFSKHKLNSLGSGGKINGLEYLRDNFDRNSQRDIGIYRFIMYNSRGEYLQKQTQAPSKQFCGLVPLILYAHKLYNNVPYSNWCRETLHYVVHKSLCDAMLWEGGEGTSSNNFYGWGSEALCELQNLALMQNNSKTGVMESRSPTTTYSLYRLGDSVLADTPTLAQIMVLQTWCAHPTNRSKYMVLDPKSWDAMPPPLVSNVLFKSETSTSIKPKLHSGTKPW